MRDSTIKSFDLQSFWFGFGTDTGTTAGLAQAGVLSVLAYDATGKQLPVVTFSYVPDSTLNGHLQYAELPATFKNLQNVTFAVATSEPITERTYIGLDNVRHINHSWVDFDAGIESEGEMRVLVCGNNEIYG